MENNSQQALTILRERMTADDMRQLSDTELFQLGAICQHWQAMAATERYNRINTPSKSLEKEF